jgi:hypothetical protein
MEEGRIQKKVLNGKFHNRRPVGRPRIRWEDAVQKDTLQILGTRGWRRRAENSEEGGQGPEGAVVPWMDGFQHTWLAIKLAVFYAVIKLAVLVLMAETY